MVFASWWPSFPDELKASLKIKVAYGGETSRNSAAHLRFVSRAPLKIQMACGGETSRNSAAHLRHVGKQAIGVG